ncbi:pyrroline-5-carboxylate reductase [Rhodomicrobium vannielii]|nr:pyrroline-5-carboxylate reductase [Rhodomicrobium vannielii]
MTDTGRTSSIFLVGAGRMGGALLRGWLRAGFPPTAIAVREPQPSAQMTALLQEKGIPMLPEDEPDVMVLAVKPQILPEVLPEVVNHVGPHTVVLSIAAGRTVSGIADQFRDGTAIVRAMPNLPAEVGRGVTGAFPNANVTDAQRELCDKLLRAVGEVVWVDDEGQLDAVTAVSGSGPAYVFYLAECLAHAAEEAGLPSDMAMKLARATVEGAGELMHRSPLEAAKLRENVTSPGGTTAAALAVLSKDEGLKALMREAIAAAARRSRELSQ